VTLHPQVGDAAPDFEFVDTSGSRHKLSDFWTDRSALIVWLRHFG
jgi:peroxiredoxin